VPLYRLEYGAVLAVNRKQPDSELSNEIHKKVSGRHQSFLVGEGDILPGTDCGGCWYQAGGADNGSHNHFRFIGCCGGYEPIYAPQNHNVKPRAAFFQAGNIVAGSNNRNTGCKLPDLVCKQIDVFSGSHGYNPEAIRVGTDNLQRADTD
jgi:hypothetical protein